MMTILGIETATERLSAALLVEQEKLYERHEESRLSHCEQLTGFILELIDDAQITLDSLNSVAVSVGPGSFTGLRIGIATAMGLAYGLDIPVCGINSLMGLAHASAEKGKLVCPIIDAKRSEVYTAVYRTTGDIPDVVFKPAALSISELITLLRDINETVTITGPAMELFHDQVKKSLGSKVTFSTKEKAKPSASAIAELGLRMIRSDGGVNPGSLKPVYLRRSDAEIQRDTK